MAPGRIHTTKRLKEVECEKPFGFRIPSGSIRTDSSRLREAARPPQVPSPDKQLLSLRKSYPSPLVQVSSRSHRKSQAPTPTGLAREGVCRSAAAHPFPG